MSVEAREWAKQVLRGRSDLPESAKRLLDCLADMHNPKYGGCFPNNRHLMSVLGKSRALIQRNLQILESEGLLKRLMDEKRTILLPVDDRWGALPIRRGEPHQLGGGASRVRRGGLTGKVAKPVDIAEKGNQISHLAVGASHRKGNRKGKLKGNGKGEVSSGTLTPLEEPPMKVEDVLTRHGVCETPEQAIKQFRTAIAGKGAANGGVVWKLWRDLVSAHHPKAFLKQPSNVQLAQLKSLYRAVGDELPAVLATVVGEWTWYVKYVKENAGASLWKEDKKAGYMIPSIAFVVKYLELAVNFHRIECHLDEDVQREKASHIGPDPLSLEASQPGLVTPLHTANQEGSDTPLCQVSHTMTDTPVDVASQLDRDAQCRAASPELADLHESLASPHNEDTQGSVASRCSTDIRSPLASRYRSGTQTSAVSRANQDTQVIPASLEREERPTIPVRQPCAETRNDEASPLARDAPNEKASLPTTDTHGTRALLQSVAKHAVKQVVDSQEKTLTNKLESGQIESDEARRRKEALEILKRY